MHRTRPAFTLVELMIVLMIIGMLMGLLFPAVQRAREAGRTTQCLNKMRELTSSLQSFEKDKNQYPGYLHYPHHVIAFDTSTGTPIFGNAATAWFPQLLPYVGRSDMWDAPLSATTRVAYWKTPFYDSAKNQLLFYGVPLPGKLVCPSDGAKLRFTPQGNTTDLKTSYVVNSGPVDASANTRYPADWRANAVFLNLYDGQNHDLKTYRQSASWVSNGDGLQHTLMMSENLDAIDWFDIGEAYNCFVYWPPPTVNAQFLQFVKINGDRHPTNAFARARPSSNHIGGVNVSFCSGSAKFMNDDIDYNVFRTLMTPNGRYANQPGSGAPDNDTRQAEQSLTGGGNGQYPF